MQDFFLQPGLTPVPTPIVEHFSVTGRVTRSSNYKPLSIWVEYCNLMAEMWETKSVALSPEKILQVNNIVTTYLGSLEGPKKIY